MTCFRILYLPIIAACIPVLAEARHGNYFQQEVNTRIETSLDVRSHQLHSYINIEYINNSPDSLCFIYFHLWPNAYSDNKTDLAQQLLNTRGKQKLFNDPSQRGYIDSLEFRVDGSLAKTDYINKEICRIILPGILPPGDTIVIETPFRTKIPQGNISRMGFLNGIYQVSQWFPKPAVYDNDGWHPMSYLDQGEFYSEYGNYDVFINVPEGFVVAASGTLTTVDEINWIDNYASYWQNNFLSENITQESKILHFSGKNIHDFAWVASSRFRVKKDTITLASGKKVSTMIMYSTDQAYQWEKALEYVNRSIIVFSKWIGDYPYDQFVAIQTPVAAGSGMEYPAMAVIGYTDSDYSLEEVIAHEVCHSWFYSALGSNERRYPYMDESLASAYENRYMDLFHPGKKLWEIYFRNKKVASLIGIDDLPVDRIDELEWIIPARLNIEQPVNLDAEEYTPANYSSMVYSKGSMGFNFLRSYLGDTLFDSIMNKYYSKWNGRHPSPDDLRDAFGSAEKDLDWFFSDFLGTVKKTDYAIKDLEENTLLVKNMGKTAPPLHLTASDNGKEVFNLWITGFTGLKRIQLPGIAFSELKINNDHLMPEINHLNNNIVKRGILKKRDPVNPMILFSVYDISKRPVFLLPVVNWTRGDGFMAGMTLSNTFLISRSFEYSAIPFFTFRDQGMAGKGGIIFNILTFNRITRKLSLSVEGSTFGYSENKNYHSVKSGIDIYFRNKNLSHGINKKLGLYYINATDPFELLENIDSEGRSFVKVVFSAGKQSVINPLMTTLTSESGSSFSKIVTRIDYTISYNGKNNGLDLSILAGGMIRENRAKSYYSLAPSGRSGRELYLLEGDFPDRFAFFTESILGRQMLINEGALVTPINNSTGYSKWLISFSANSSLPGRAGKIPLKPFINIVYPGNNNTIYLETGFQVGIQGFFEIYIPLITSANISAVKPGINERIRFVLNLDSFLKLRISD